MNLTLNGQPHETEPQCTIVQLLEQLEIPPTQVAVEVNQLLIPREQHGNHRLADGDQVEVVRLVGGG